MARRYRKTESVSNRKGREAPRGRQPDIVDRDEALAGCVAVELPVSLAEVLDGVLAPTGMRSAGQPRQLGTMKIRMDAYPAFLTRLLDLGFRELIGGLVVWHRAGVGHKG
ncbi:MAG: hypothetical protein PVI86_18910 [Phycisphaerae bacterium]|jgi:hypothetical protein